MSVAVAVVASLAGAPTSVRASDPDPAWLLVNSWSQKQGMPENTVRAMLEARDGYLWLATFAGVARFDGVRFTVFSDRHRGPLREIEVQAIAEARDGALWIGTWGGGITRIQEGRFTTLTTRDGLINDFVISLCADQDGGLWIGTDAGVSRLDGGGRFRSFTTADGLPNNRVHLLYRDPRDGSIWAAIRNGGLARFRDGRFSVETIPGIPAEAIVRDVLRARDQTLWVATQSGLFRVADGAPARHYTAAAGLSSERTSGLHQDAAGNLWIVSDKGLDRFRDERFHSVAALAGRVITAVASSRDGCLWAGTGWLACLAESQFTSFTDKEGLPHPYVTTFLEDAQGRVWIATARGLGYWRAGVVRSLAAEQGLPTGFTGALTLDREGRLWVGTDAGIYRSLAPLGDADSPAGPRFARVPDQPARTVQARSMFTDRDGAVWIGANLEGVVRYQGDRFTAYTTREGLLHDAVRAIVQDREGNVWIGTRAGLNRFRDGKLTGYGVADGLAHPTIVALHVDRQDALWIATRQGVSRRAGGRFASYTADDGLLCSHVNSFVEDDRGNLWMSCTRGVFRVPRQAFDDFAAGKLPILPATSYGVEDGLVTTRATAGIDRAGHRTRDGRLWFATVRGASVVDPARLRPGPPPPPVHIEEVRVDDQLLARGRDRGVQAPPGRGDLAVRYTAPSFVAPEKVQFRYRLHGHDRDWVEAENRREAFYSNLPPGRYTFEVTAANDDGVFGRAAATIDLFLRPHWYQTWWFRVSAALAALLLAAGGYRRRVRQLERRQRELERSVAERTAELAAANKELESFSYSVSHDLRAPLRWIDGFGQALVERHAARLDTDGLELVARMRRASESMDHLIDDMLALARVTSSEMDRTDVDLGALARDVFDELRARQPERQVALVAAEDLHVSADVNLMRIALSNLVGNAWKFTGKNPAATIEVGVVRADGTAPAFFVRDDGVGFDPAEAGRLFSAFQRLHSPAEFEGSGVGLATVARVIERHGGRIWAEGQPGKGATFYFTVPP